jgi:ABC-type multidrug transport system ATPase subunit
MTEPAIKIENLIKTYQSATAVDSVSLEIPYGERFGLIGPDGAGKTSLIRILCALLPYDSGTAVVAGFDPNQQIRKVRSLVGYMPQRFSLYPDLSVFENLKFYADLFGVTTGDRIQRLKELLAFSRLEPFLKRRAGALSGGMKQKLALACILIHEPKILLLDEPTTGVDPLSRHEFWELLKRLTDRGITIIVSTPYMEEAARCHRIALMANGCILQIDTPENISSTYPHTLFNIATPNPFQAASVLEKHPGVLSVQIFGAGLHVAVESPQELPAIEAELAQKNILVGIIKPITPSIEDVFVENLTIHE